MTSYFEARRITPATYDNFVLQEYVSDELPSEKNAKILDIGCGFGMTLKKLRELSYTNMHGIDIDKDAVDYCKKEELDVSLISDLKTFFQENTKKYDFILMQHLIEHLKKEDIIPILNMIYENVLAENGKILITTPNAQSVIGAYWAHEDFTHDLLFTSGSLYYVLYMAGFRDIRFIDIYATSNLIPLKKMIRRISYKIYNFYNSMRNKMLASFYHEPSERIFSWEVKVVAKK